MGQSDFPTVFRLPSIGLARRTWHPVRFRLRPTSVSGFPLSWLMIRIPCRFLQAPLGPLKFSNASLCPCQALGTPTGPRESHRTVTLDRRLCSLLSAGFPGGATVSRLSFWLTDSFVLASVALTTSPPVLMLLTRLNRFRVVHHPSGLGNTRSTLHDFGSPVSADRSANTAPPAAQDSIRVGG
jgi:hypothetical protein